MATSAPAITPTHPKVLALDLALRAPEELIFHPRRIDTPPEIGPVTTLLAEASRAHRLELHQEHMADQTEHRTDPRWRRHNEGQALDFGPQRIDLHESGNDADGPQAEQRRDKTDDHQKRPRSRASGHARS